MIDALIIEQFQAHKYSELEFSKGVNAIIGESDEGKSSILRAIYLTAQNKPSGDDYISDSIKKGEACTSTLVIGENEITRAKSKTRNEYWINDQEFKAFGKGGVPDEVQDILNLSELNFQSQMDPPFLLSQNSGEVAKFLNKIVDLDIIDSSLKKINSKVSASTALIKSTEEDIEFKNIEIAELNWIDKAQRELNRLEIKQNKYEQLSTNNTALGALLDDIEDLNTELSKFDIIDLKSIDALILKIQNQEKANLELNELDSALNGIDNLEKQLDELKDIPLEAFDSLILKIGQYNKNDYNLVRLGRELNGIKDVNYTLDSLVYNSDELKDIARIIAKIGPYQEEKESLKILDNLLIEIEVDFVNEIVAQDLLIKELELKFSESFPETCPLCSEIR